MYGPAILLLLIWKFVRFVVRFVNGGACKFNLLRIINKRILQMRVHLLLSLLPFFNDSILNHFSHNAFIVIFKCRFSCVHDRIFVGFSLIRSLFFFFEILCQCFLFVALHNHNAQILHSLSLIVGIDICVSVDFIDWSEIVSRRS